MPLAVVVGAIAVLAVVIALLEVMPTIHDSSEDTYSIELKNDAPQSVSVGLCLDTKCARTSDDQLLPVGDNGRWNATANVTTTLKITAPNRVVVGCVRSNSRKGNVTRALMASNATACT